MAPAANGSSNPKEDRSGLIAGIAAFGTWGLIPVYWKLFTSISASEILAHRFVWTTAFLVGLLSWQQRWPEVREAARSRRAFFYCIASGLAISVNWFCFIWAVNADRVIETSLGYFMTPLVNVLFGATFLREKLTRWQMLSVLLALVGVLNLTLGYGRFPWLAITICVSFGLYGLLRKQSGVRPIPGLFLETTLLTPIAVLYLVYLQRGGHSAVSTAGLSMILILMSTGIVTGVPLVWFGHAARHLRLTTLGFLQYLSPSCSFFLGVFLYHEPFTRTHLMTFMFIWVALIIFTAEAIWRWRSDRERETLTEPVARAAH
ncbi:MAG TPA: EamA family transporter RarD [Chthoniobacterales bacterium]|jgi:chloramphenicol-sensitive protein RarD|nr:EamA family transporter RarD [Chthoniobacterales bacterium]